MAVELLPEACGELVQPFIPVAKAKPESGRPRLTDSACLAGIVFVLCSGSLEDAAPRNGPWLRNELLAPTARPTGA
jgi:transposase